MQYFKGDDIEKKFEACGIDILDSLSASKDAFLAGAYSCGPMGDLLWETFRSPLANAITRDIFRTFFNTLFTEFISSGTFESYITVFKKIFDDSVNVQFTVPGPGLLTIAITADSPVESDFVAREVEGSTFVYYSMLTQAGENIEFQTIKGFQSQYELEQMLFELVPAGISTTITLSLVG